jgi:hypothetical protein
MQHIGLLSSVVIYVYTRTGVITTVKINVITLCVMTPCSLVGWYQCFGYREDGDCNLLSDYQFSATLAHTEVNFTWSHKLFFFHERLHRKPLTKI